MTPGPQPEEHSTPTGSDAPDSIPPAALPTEGGAEAAPVHEKPGTEGSGMPESVPGQALPPEIAASNGDAEAEIESNAYRVQLDAFEGPLDLLLYLIQRDELDIYDIPIAHITQQYLEQLDEIDVFSLDNAGEFLVMAATLMRIKARMLLPIQRPEEDDEELIDPRDELVRRLLEYKKYKEAAEKLGSAEETRRDFYGRGTRFQFTEAEKDEEEPAELSLSMFDLLKAVRNIFDQLQGTNVHQVFREVFTVEQQSARILDMLASGESVRFEDVFAEARVKMEVVVTFIAMLELMKQAKLKARQVDCYGDIYLYAPEESDAA